MNAKEFEDRFKRNTIPAMPLSPGTCQRCMDCGFCRVQADSEKLWAYCSCPSGKNKFEQKKFELPRIDNELLKVYPLVEFPLQSFIPSTFSVDMKKEMWTKAGKFEDSLKSSEKAWAEK